MIHRFPDRCYFKRISLESCKHNTADLEHSSNSSSSLFGIYNRYTLLHLDSNSRQNNSYYNIPGSSYCSLHNTFQDYSNYLHPSHRSDDDDGGDDDDPNHQNDDPSPHDGGCDDDDPSPYDGDCDDDDPSLHGGGFHDGGYDDDCDDDFVNQLKHFIFPALFIFTNQ